MTIRFYNHGWKDNAAEDMSRWVRRKQIERDLSAKKALAATLREIKKYEKQKAEILASIAPEEAERQTDKYCRAYQEWYNVSIRREVVEDMIADNA